MNGQSPKIIFGKIDNDWNTPVYIKCYHNDFLQRHTFQKSDLRSHVAKNFRKGSKHNAQ